MKDKKFHIGNGKPKQRLFFNNINKNKYIKLQKKTKHYKKNQKPKFIELILRRL